MDVRKKDKIINTELENKSICEGLPNPSLCGKQGDIKKSKISVSTA